MKRIMNNFLHYMELDEEKQDHDCWTHISGTLGGNSYPVLKISDDGIFLTLYKVPKKKNIMINQGDRLQIDSIKTYNPFALSRYVLTRYPLVCIAVKDEFGDGEGNITIEINRELITQGDYANVERLPIKDDVVYIFPNFKISLPKCL